MVSVHHKKTTPNPYSNCYVRYEPPIISNLVAALQGSIVVALKQTLLQILSPWSSVSLLRASLALGIIGWADVAVEAVLRLRV